MLTEDKLCDLSDAHELGEFFMAEAAETLRDVPRGRRRRLCPKGGRVISVRRAARAQGRMTGLSVNFRAAATNSNPAVRGAGRADGRRGSEDDRTVFQARGDPITRTWLRGR